MAWQWYEHVSNRREFASKPDGEDESGLVLGSVRTASTVRSYSESRPG